MPDQATKPLIRLDPWADSDLDLLRRVNAPEMTEHLGGPETEARVVSRHGRYLAMGDPGAGGMFRITLLPDGVAAGSIGYWEREWLGETVYEMGWGVLPGFQGRGIATAAAVATVAIAQAQRTHRAIHAYPSVEHAASNAICRKAGFTLLGPIEFEYPKGHVMRCNDWRLEFAVD